MSQPYIPMAEAFDELRRLSRLVDEIVDKGALAAHEHAQAEDAYRMAYALAYTEATGTVREREMRADLATSRERQRARLADSMARTVREALRARLGQLSALQTLLSAQRAEAEFNRRGPR